MKVQRGTSIVKPNLIEDTVNYIDRQNYWMIVAELIQRIILVVYIVINIIVVVIMYSQIHIGINSGTS
jgi:hypothetical protein